MSRCVFLLCMLTWPAVAARYYKRTEITRAIDPTDEGNSTESANVNRGWAVRAIYVRHGQRGSRYGNGYPVTTYQTGHYWDSDEPLGHSRERYGYGHHGHGHHSGGRSRRGRRGHRHHGGRSGRRHRGGRSSRRRHGGRSSHRHHGGRSGRHHHGGRSDRYDDVSWDPYADSAELYAGTEQYGGYPSDGYQWQSGGSSWMRDDDDDSDSSSDSDSDSHSGGRSGRPHHGGWSGRYQGGRSSRQRGGRSGDFDWLYRSRGSNRGSRYPGYGW